MSRPRPSAANAERERLIESHLPLVRSLAHRFVGRGEELDDLVQVGTVGLIKAADRFDRRRGVSFRAFATPAVEGEIRRHLRDRTGSLRIPRALQQMNGELRRCRQTLTAKLGHPPTVQELARELGVDQSDVERAMLAARARDSLELSRSDPAVQTERFADADPVSDDRLLITRSMQHLGERERRIVFLRFHADLTERQIAQTVGISQAQVSRVLTAALTTLRRHLAGAADSEQRDITEVQPIPAARTPGDAAQTEADRGFRIAGVGGASDTPKRDTTTEGPARVHSGRFLVRMPGELHAQLAEAADREHVSLNRFVNDALAASIAHADRSAPVVEAAGDDADQPADTTTGEAHKPARALQIALATNLVVVGLAGVAAVILLALALQHGA